ncbi:MAG TPA: restriction endonuclease subunit S [Ignavibacteriaceae bacterium]|nr:restriction endonuclease subunit S [Ignavibacteriaceae bacterium]
MESNQNDTRALSKELTNAVWDMKSLGEIGTFSKGKGISKEQISSTGLPCIRYGEIYTTHEVVIKQFKSFISEEIAEESQLISKGDVLFAGSGETIEDIGKAVAYIGEERAYAGGDIIVLSTNEEVQAEFLSFTLNTDIANKQKRRLGQGQQVVHIYPSDLAQIKIPLPPLPEQRAIARVLNTWDTAIHTTEKLIAQKELRKKWLMQQLLSGKRRLKGFGSEWGYVRFNEIYSQIKRTACYDKFIVLSVTKDGIVSQAEYFNKEIASEDTSQYLVIKRGDMVMSGLNFWMGSIDVLTAYEVGMVSPAYKAFEISNENISPAFMKYFVRSEVMLRALVGSSVTGASIVRRNLDRETLDEWSFHLPDLNEQTAIAQILQVVNKEISLLKTKAEKLREQKKGLMQVLLTGHKRLNH